jgi:hypothetical protein
VCFSALNLPNVHFNSACFHRLECQCWRTVTEFDYKFCLFASYRTHHCTEVGLIWGSRFRFPAGAGNFSLHHRVQNDSGAHSASYPVGTRGSFPGGKADGA